MTDVPRRRPLTQEQRLRTIAQHTAGGSLQGGTPWGKRVTPPTSGGSGAVKAFQVEPHGDDPTVARPVALLVYWIGAATPSNAMPYDFWYTATI